MSTYRVGLADEVMGGRRLAEHGPICIKILSLGIFSSSNFYNSSLTRHFAGGWSEVAHEFRGMRLKSLPTCIQIFGFKIGGLFLALVLRAPNKHLAPCSKAANEPLATIILEQNRDSC